MVKNISIKKIFWVAHEGNRSGANNALLDYAGALNSNVYSITIIIPSKGNMWKQCIERNLNVKMFSYYSVMGSNRKKYWLFWVKKRLRNLLTFFQVFFYFSRNKPYVVITNSIVSPPLFASIASFLGIKRIWYIQEFGNKDHGIQFDWGYNFTLRYINYLSDRVIVVSDALRRHVVPRISNDKITTVFNRVNIPELFWGKGPAKKKIPYRILHIAQVAPGKNQLEGLKALSLLLDQGINVVLEIAGAILDDEYKCILDRFIIEENIGDKVSFSGFSNNPFEKIMAANLVILCSRSEACALTIFETLRIGTPIIVSDTGGNTEIIKDGETGLVYKYGNPKDLADKITRFYLNQELSDKISDSAKRYSLEYYDSRISVNQIKGIIEAGK
jgi:L-malate glycosyltransferase